MRLIFAKLLVWFHFWCFKKVIEMFQDHFCLQKSITSTSSSDELRLILITICTIYSILSSFEFTTSCKLTIAKILHRSFQLRNDYVILQNPFYWSIFKLINSVVYIINIHGLYRPIYKPHRKLWTPYLLPRRKKPLMGLDEITYLITRDL